MAELYPVLTFPRTGSSLVMQTLAKLGVQPWGERFRGNLPRIGNPEGYFEDPDLIYGPLSALKYQQLRSSKCDSLAYKISIQALVDSSEADWLRVFASARHAFISVRNPIEAACSRIEVFVEPKNEVIANLGLKKFLVANAALIEYRKIHLKLLDRLGNLPPELSRRLSPVHYQLAAVDRAAYVRFVSERLDRAPAAVRIATAVANIDGTLYRYRIAGMKAHVVDWAKRSGASEVHERLNAYFRSEGNKANHGML